MKDYSLIISDMTWSYSRINLYSSCPYAWFLKYILGKSSSKNFYGEYGTFIHELLAEFYNNEKNKDQILIKFLAEFDNKVPSVLRSKTFEKTKSKYYNVGANYLETFEPIKFKEILGVEDEFVINIDGYKFTGFIDLWGISEDGEIDIYDHKSKDLKPRSKRGKVTLTDIELDEYLRQLYLYSIYVFEKTGKYPKRLNFNCFKSGNIITEEFNIEKLEEAKTWAINSIKKIEKDTEWLAVGDFMFCKDLCDNRTICEFVE